MILVRLLERLACLSLAGAALTLILLPPAEYLLHRLVMHHETAIAPGAFDRHHVQHHRRGRLDVNVDLPVLWTLIYGSPLLVVLCLAMGWQAALGSALVLALYGILWTGLHRAIHGVGGRWATWLPFYNALERHHEAHHAHVGRNYGTVFGPLLDWPLGTWTR
jgi:hypothetical protein